MIVRITNKMHFRPLHKPDIAAAWASGSKAYVATISVAAVVVDVVVIIVVVESFKSATASVVDVPVDNIVEEGVNDVVAEDNVLEVIGDAAATASEPVVDVGIVATGSIAEIYCSIYHYLYILRVEYRFHTMLR